jgi:transcriptional regulator with XRE-family HTH domain
MFDRFNLGEIIGANIKARRKAAGMTQIELANKCGCYYDSQPVREWEHGRVPKLETLERIADGLSCYVSELLPSYYFPPKKDGWISVKDRLPEKDEYVLCFCNIGDGFQAIFHYGKERKFDGTAVTHWMPLPNPPEVTP